MSIDASPYDFHLKTGDTSPAIERQLTDDEDAPIDLSQVGSVTFVMTSPRDDLPTVSGAANVVAGDTPGVVRYEWSADDTAVAGSYHAEFEVTWPDGSTETFPNDSYVSVRITPDLGGSA